MAKIPGEYKFKDGSRVLARVVVQDYFTKERAVIFSKENDPKYYSLEVHEFGRMLAVPEQKQNISLYRSLFQGREDVYANRWFNKKLNRFSYSPTYIWKRDPQLGKSKIAEDEHGNRRYQALTDDKVRRHLNGQDFLGVYPILKDETCYFVALDFDKKEWKTAAVSLLHIAQTLGIEAHLERSQSGNGAHVWIFFKEAIPCKMARKLASSLLTKTIMENPQLSFACFDRIFPSQDTLPGPKSKSFGNLIALPLQGNRLAQGNSAFLDEDLLPYEDQWQYLANINRYSREEVSNFIERIVSTYELAFFESEKEESIDLLKEVPPKMEKLTIQSSNVLTIDKAELDKQTLARLKGLASFHNPEFYQKQAMRMSTYQLPRIISLYEENEENLYLPRGLKDRLYEVVEQIDWQEENTKSRKIKVTFQGKLRGEQKEAFAATNEHKTGVISAKTGFGKTVLACKMIANKKVNTLILVQNKNLSDQWKHSLEQFLKIDSQPLVEYTATGRKRKKERIGQLYGGKDKRSELVDIATFQTLAKRKDSADLINRYGMVIVDECHHIPANTFEQVLIACKANYLYGLSATPKRKDGHEPIIFMRLGPVIWQDNRKLGTPTLEQKLYPRFVTTGEDRQAVISQNTIQENYHLIMENERRNDQICVDILKEYNAKRHILVLSDRINHLQLLQERIAKLSQKPLCYQLTGRLSDRKQREITEKLQQEKRPFILFATGSFIGEGFDLASLDTILLTMPISGAGRIEQYLGRLQRNLHQKTELHLYDYIDFVIPMFSNMYQKRLATYRKLHYQVVVDKKSMQEKPVIFSEEEYLASFEKDLINAKKEIVLATAVLSRSIVQKIQQLKKEKQVEVWTTLPTMLDEKYQTVQQNLIRTLEKEVVVKCREIFVPNLCVIDREISWYGSIRFWGKNTQKTILRLKFPSVAKKFLQVWNQE